MPLCCLLLVALAAHSAVPPPPQPAGTWQQWRGPFGHGSSDANRAPLKWSATDNIAWRTPLTGRGLSSPIVAHGRVFLTSADDAAEVQSVLAFDVKTGKPLWSTPVSKGGFPRKYSKNSHASATPACDARHVYSVFVHHDAVHVVAIDFDGAVAWQSKVGEFSSQHGYGSSPTLHGGLVLVNGDSLKSCVVAGLDCVTGKVVWKTDRKTTGKNGSYGTPVVATLSRKPQLLLMGLGETASYDPATGKQLWSCVGPAEVAACTPAVDFGTQVVLATGGYPEKEILAIHPHGSGDVSASQIAWRTKSGVSYVPSPIAYHGHFYVVNDGGLATCFEALSGRQEWQQRLAGAFTSSPIRVADRLYVTNEAGRTYVFRAAPKYELLATNDLGEDVLATPAVVAGQLFVRTEKALYCIGK